jgi:N-acetylglucosaminyl-diphospho-decaprenol L-rhamnosyltransferase
MTRGPVHAIVVNFRTPDLAAGAVAALQASILSERQLHIHIVDNGSGDDSVERLRAAYPHLDITESGRNLGFAGGNNLAIRRILAQFTTDTPRQDTFILLVNSDVVVEPDAVAKTLQFMEDHPDTGIVGPKVLLPNGQLDLACRRGFPTPARAFWKLTGLSRLFPSNPRFTGYNLTHLDENETTEVDSVVGAYMLLRLAAIDMAGILDERFFMYGEDLDWAYRVKAHGWRVHYYPEARVLHLKGATSRRQSTRMILEFYRAMWLFHFKHYAPRSLFLINWLVAAGILARGALALTANALRPVQAKRVS